MRTAGPATRSAHSAVKLRESFLDTDVSRLRLLAGSNPADPFVTGERCNIIPYFSRLRRSHNRLSPIIGHFVYRPTRQVFLHHRVYSSKSDGILGRF